MRRLTAEAAGIRNYIAEMSNYTPELPDLTFDRELVLHDKDQDLHLAFRGRAHTSGDVVVFCPQKKVVATGDMIHSLVPFIADGFPREWPGTMRSVAELPFDHLIGGHGPVQHGKTHLHGMAGYIEEITAAVAREKQEISDPDAVFDHAGDAEESDRRIRPFRDAESWRIRLRG